MWAIVYSKQLSHSFCIIHRTSFFFLVFIKFNDALKVYHYCHIEWNESSLNGNQKNDKISPDGRNDIEVNSDFLYDTIKGKHHSQCVN